ncbi:MAG: hypothetical protein KGI08_11510, partial [Thaumarchaeota archaeon]|nr:hypothetical protein [Nitrososphaerota archaeon]
DRILDSIETRVHEQESLDEFQARVRTSVEEVVFIVLDTLADVTFEYTDVDDIQVTVAGTDDRTAEDITEYVRQAIGDVYADGGWICAYDYWTAEA